MTAHYKEIYPLIFAAGEGASGTVADLLAAGHDVRERSKDGETVLHVNAIKGDTATTQVLLAAGAEVDARTPKGGTLWMTPLMWATYGGHVEMCKLLLNMGADPTAADENGKAVLTMAQEARHAEVEALLREYIEKWPRRFDNREKGEL